MGRCLLGLDKDLYDLEREEKSPRKVTPGSLEDVLNSLEADHEFRLKERCSY
jgi:glutamine synthetase